MAINTVAAVVDELQEVGVPMPRQLAYLDPIGKFFKRCRARALIYSRPVAPEPKPAPVWEYVEKPWEDWDDFSYRVHTEKMKAKEAKYEVGLLLACMACSRECSLSTSSAQLSGVAPLSCSRYDECQTDQHDTFCQSSEGKLCLFACGN